MKLSQNWNQSPGTSKAIDVAMSSINTEDDLITDDKRINVVFTDQDTVDNGKPPQAIQLTMDHNEAFLFAERLIGKIDGSAGRTVPAVDIEATREAEDVYDSNTLES